MAQDHGEAIADRLAEAFAEYLHEGVYVGFTGDMRRTRPGNDG